MEPGKLDREGLTALMLSVAEAWQRLNPGEELVWVTLPRDDEQERRRILESLVRLLGPAEK